VADLLDATDFLVARQEEAPFSQKAGPLRTTTSCAAISPRTDIKWLTDITEHPTNEG
jgi:hypothetical protein